VKCDLVSDHVRRRPFSVIAAVAASIEGPDVIDGHFK
jgi:hypothetical protein